MMRTLGLRAATALACVALAAAAPADAQQPARTYRIGFLGPRVAADDPRVENMRQFREGLRDAGYVEGRNLVIEWRLGESYEAYPSLVADLVRIGVDVIVTPNTPGAMAAKRATKSIPIVFTAVADPVGSGLVASLARPGGNLTGLSNLMPDTSAKRLQLLKESFPSVSRVAMVFNATNPGNARSAAEAVAAAPSLKIAVHSFDVRDLPGLTRAFADIRQQRAQAMLVLQDAFLLTHRTRIAEFAASSRLPSVFDAREFVDAGGLIGYGPSRSDLFRRVGGYVHRILRGAQPGELPVEQPSKLELILNFKSAAALGLVFPPALVQQADEVIR